MSNQYRGCQQSRYFCKSGHQADHCGLLDLQMIPLGEKGACNEYE